jgi:hypothetical protein
MIRPLLRIVRADDAGYYRARALQEQVAAQKANCEAARKSHDQLAMMFRFRALMSPAGPQLGADPFEERALEAVS